MNAIFSVGYDGKLDDLVRIIDSSDKVRSVYTGGLSKMMSGGRPQHAKTLAELAGQINYAHSKGISFEVTMNASCGIPDRLDKKARDKIKEYIKELAAMGVNGVSVSHPFIIEMIKAYTKMKVIVSTVCEIMNVRSALYYEKMGGDIIVPSVNINKDMVMLRSIKKALKKAKLRMIMNEHCLGDCPWRKFHYNHYAHSSEEREYHFNCRKSFLYEPYLLLTNNAIRPEDAHYYEEITNNFKILGRLVPIDDLIARIKAYSSERFMGNYVYLIDTKMSLAIDIPNSKLEGLIQRMWKCSRICDECNYCKILFESIGTKPANI